MNNIISDFASLGFLAFILGLIFFIGFFLIIREITMWYFRINENTETLKSIDVSLQKIALAAEFSTTDLLERHNNKILSKKLTNENDKKEGVIFKEKSI